MTYLLDANVFIQAKNLHYGFDFCPAFWEWLDQQAQTAAVQSIDKVHDELKAGADELAVWSGARPGLFVPPDPAVLSSLQTVAAWATTAGYTPAAVSTFLQIADCYLVAQAHAHVLTVVTHEVPANSPSKIKVPDACVALSVKCVTPYEMLRNEHARFVLGQA